jgi:hypothetical protein
MYLVCSVGNVYKSSGGIKFAGVIEFLERIMKIE